MSANFLHGKPYPGFPLTTMKGFDVQAETVSQSLFQISVSCEKIALQTYNFLGCLLRVREKFTRWSDFFFLVTFGHLARVIPDVLRLTTWQTLPRFSTDSGEGVPCTDRTSLSKSEYSTRFWIMICRDYSNCWYVRNHLWSWWCAVRWAQVPCCPC